MKSKITGRSAQHSVRSALALAATSALLAIAMVFVAASPASATTAPTVTALSPSSGPTAGGTPVTITGTGFSANSTVDFGTVASPLVSVDSATSIVATSPAGTGTVDVTVTVPGPVTSATSTADQFTYGAAPTVTALSPSSGPGTGDTSVTITGTGFSANSTVKFGGVAGTVTSISSTTSLVATSPAGTGTVAVTVTTPYGTSATSTADQFTYDAAPTVTTLSPTAGPTTGGTSVTITGTGFGANSTVKFGGVAGTVTSISSTTIVATSPAGTGTVDVTVTTPYGTSATSTADHFTYGAPWVSAVSPSSGPGTGGTSVTITGTDFVPGATVKFGGVAGTVTFLSATSIRATSPAGAGTVDVTVTTPYGTSATSVADHFTYGAPSITTVSPSAGPGTGGTSVTITGTGFVPGATVRFANAVSPFVSVLSATSLVATSPAGAGTVDVTVTTPYGTSATSTADHFTYGAPWVSAVSPSSGPGTGGTSVTITGTDFVPGATVRFANATGTVTFLSATSITATSPAGAGTVDVTVTTPYGTSATSVADHFTYGALVAQAALSLTSTRGVAGTALTLASRGGSGTGALTYAVASTGTAGCWVTAGTLRATKVGTCAVRVTKAGDATYSAASPPITTVTFTAPFRATRVNGVVWVGQISIVSINGSGFYNKPTIVSNEARTGAVVIHDHGTQLVVRVRVLPGTATGWHVFTITLANGRSTRVRYLVNVRLTASGVSGVAWVGRTVLVVVNGSGFYSKPLVTSNDARISADVIHDYGNQLVVRVRVLPGTATGWHVFTITLANGHFVQVRYVVQ